MTTTQIIREVALAFNVTEGEILSRQRTERICKGRHAAFWFCRNSRQMTYDAIGIAFGGTDHGTIMHGEKRVLDYLTQDDHFLLAFAKVKAKITPITKADAEKIKALRANLKELLA